MTGCTGHSACNMFHVIQGFSKEERKILAQIDELTELRKTVYDKKCAKLKQYNEENRRT